MGKNDKAGLGRALVRQHNQMIIESKEKGRFYQSQHKKVLESVTEVTDIDAIIEKAEEADRLFSLNAFEPKVPIALDGSSSSSDLPSKEKGEKQKEEEELHASSLRVPRRPKWYAGMSVDVLDANEKQSFLTWRRSLARLEENENLVLTPFEKNLDIWRQLWRVLERSDLIVMVVDARNPLFYRCPDLEIYAQELDKHKKTLLLVNKADLLPYSVREKWAQYFRLHEILFVFWSAKAASAALLGKTSSDPQSSIQESDDPDTKVYGRDELLARLQSEAEQIAKRRRNAGSSDVSSTDANSQGGSVSESSASNNVVVGFVGQAVQVVANRVPRQVIEDVYKIKLPKPKPYELQSRPPLAAELLRSYCASRGYVASSGLPDETRAARQMLKDYIDGKLQHYQLPPGMTDDEEDNVGTSSDTSDVENTPADKNNNAPNLENVLDDLNSFDMANGLTSKKGTAKKPRAPHKLHKKPQRNKNRTWRVGNDNDDGMPVVRVFQKPVNAGSLKTV
ncbi:hypothetical protein CsatA_006310 [Cannabis sativa]